MPPIFALLVVLIIVGGLSWMVWRKDPSSMVQRDKPRTWDWDDIDANKNRERHPYKYVPEPKGDAEDSL